MNKSKKLIAVIILTVMVFTNSMCMNVNAGTAYSKSKVTGGYAYTYVVAYYPGVSNLMLVEWLQHTGVVSETLSIAKGSSYTSTKSKDLTTAIEATVGGKKKIPGIGEATASVAVSAKTSSGSSDAETKSFTTTYTATIAKSDPKGYYAIEMAASGNKLVATYQKINITDSSNKTVKSRTVKFYPYKGRKPGQRTMWYSSAKLGNYTEWWEE